MAPMPTPPAPTPPNPFHPQTGDQPWWAPSLPPPPDQSWGQHPPEVGPAEPYPLGGDPGQALPPPPEARLDPAVSTLPPPPDGWGGPPLPTGPSKPPVGLQNLLLGLGTALVGIALVVFTAVNWSRMDASVQGLFLVGLTVLAAVGSTACGRRSMPATAEALGLVAVLLALADVHAFRVGLAPAGDAELFWAGGLTLVAALAWTLGRIGAIRSPQIAAGVLIQVPALLVIGRSDRDAVIFWVQLAVVVQAAIVLFLADRRPDVHRWVRWIATAWALSAVALATAVIVLGTLLASAFDEQDLFGWCALGLGALAALALYLTWLHVEAELIRVASLIVASVAGLGAVFMGMLGIVDPEIAFAAVSVACALLVVTCVRVPRSLASPVVAVAGIVGSVSVLPLIVAVAAMLVAASNVAPFAWSIDAGRSASSLRIGTSHVPDPIAVALQFGALVVLLAGLHRWLGRIGGLVSIASVALVAMAVSPLVFPLTVAGAVVAGIVVLAGAAGVAALSRGRVALLGVASGTAVLAAAWASTWGAATPGLTYAALAAGILAALTIAATCLRHRDEVPAEIGGAAAGWVAGALPLLAGLVALGSGSEVPASWAVVAVAAAVVSIIGALLLDPKGDESGMRGVMGRVVEVVSLGAYGLAMAVLACSGDAAAASVGLAAGVVAFGLHAARPARRPAALVAAGEAVVLVWVQLDQAQVTVFEAYTLPLAALLLAVGLFSQRMGRRNGEVLSSWVTLGPALVVAMAPTVWMALLEHGSLRPLAGLVAGAVVLVTGVLTGKRALVDVGAATVTVLGLRQLAPVVGEIPNWVAIGLTGLLLLAVGATFEQRRQNLRAARRRYSALT